MIRNPAKSVYIKFDTMAMDYFVAIRQAREAIKREEDVSG